MLPISVLATSPDFRIGCDYNLIEAEPGDLDPHAVSSIFKTFLREREQRMFDLVWLELMTVCSPRASLDYEPAAVL